MAPAEIAAADFRRDWAQYHPGCLPLGWALHSHAASPWVRFHALPGSKRYAENATDRDITLFRANALGDRLLGIGQCCWFIESEAGDPSRPGEVTLTAVETDDPDDPAWSFYARREPRQAGANCDALRLSIADDGPKRAIWMRCENGCGVCAL